MRHHRRWSVLLLAGLALSVVAAAGCGSPSQANILLRKENQQLQERIAGLQKEHEADRQRIDALQSRTGTAPVIAQATLDQLFTTDKVELGRLTGEADLDYTRPGSEGIKVYLMPEDQTGETIKVPGHLTVELFDLSLPGDNRLGQWKFTPQQLKDRWRSLGPLHAFVVECPWQKLPGHRKLTLHVIFDDALTGRRFTLDKSIDLRELPATQPAASSH